MALIERKTTADWLRELHERVEMQDRVLAMHTERIERLEQRVQQLENDLGIHNYDEPAQQDECDQTSDMLHNLRRHR